MVTSRDFAGHNLRAVDRRVATTTCGTVLGIGLLISVLAPNPANSASPLKGQFDLAGSKSAGTRCYQMTTDVIHLSPDGKRRDVETYDLWIEWARGTSEDRDSEVFTCRRLTVVRSGKLPVSIPALKDWTYKFHRFSTGLEDKGQIFGIDHAHFEKLTDGGGNLLPPDVTYSIYNTLIDFHSLCNVFAERTREGKGIQDLRRIGDRIVHASAFSQPPVNLGTSVEQGSTFRNGEVTLEFKGLSVAGNARCALIGYDSGQSSFEMILRLSPQLKVQAIGGSHYRGDIYIDLDTRWIIKANLTEMVVTEVIVPALAGPVHSVIERQIDLRAHRPADFLRLAGISGSSE